MSQQVVDLKMDEEKKIGHNEIDESDTASVGKGDILSLENTDPVLNAKMHMINNVGHLSYLLPPHCA